MKTRRFLPVLALLSAPLLSAADQPAPKVQVKPAEAAVEASSFKTADEFWAHLEKLQVPPAREASTQEESATLALDWYGKQRAAAEAFQKAYPADPRRWTAAILELRTSVKMRQLTSQPLVLPEDRPKIAAIVGAPTAPVMAKGEAAYMGVLLTTEEFDNDKPETFAAFYRAAADYAKNYPEHPLLGQLKQLQLQTLNADSSPAADELLKKLAADESDPRSAGVAKLTIERKQTMADLKSKPVDLKFTSADGHEIDLANLRGKVVLVDFWASWCGPCIAEMPNVVSTYDKWHARGFEIIGICLDQDKGAMGSALKKHKMTWAQQFDGTGWENKFSKQFGVRAIPAAFLIDKKGLIRETGLRGEALAAGVEKLLAEK